MDNRIAIPILCLAAVAYACGPWHRGSTPEPVITDATTAEHSALRIATVFNVLPKTSGVEFALYVLNNSPKTVELRFPSSMTHDFMVLDDRGNTVWQWSDGRMFTQAMQSKIVKASDTLSIVDGWDARNAHGKYIAVARLNTDTQTIERRVAFTLP